MSHENEVVFINALSAKLGGGRTYLINLLRHNNIKLIYVACPDKSMLPISDNVVYFETGFANRNIFYRAIWEFLILPFVLIKLKVDVLFVPGGMDFTLKSNRIKKVTMFRNMLPFDDVSMRSISSKVLMFKNILLKKLMIRTMNSADHIIFISEYAKLSIDNLLKANNRSVIYHGIGDVFVPQDSSFEKEEDFILYVSRFESYKNHLNLIKAYNMLDANIRNKHSLVLVGEQLEPGYSECLRFIKRQKLEGNIEILGKVEYENLPALYQRCKLFVFPSSCENCPNILLEAVGCGAPIAISHVSPMPEFALDSAIYFDASDVASIHDVIKRVLTNDTLRDQLIIRSKLLRESYTWERTAFLTWQCLKSVGG